MLVDSVMIVGNIASGNDPDQGGGGLFNDGGDLTVRMSTVVNNIADGTAGSGGGILNTAGGTLIVNSTLIQGNTSVRAGGGVEDNASITTLTDVDLIGNETGPTPGNGGGFHSTGASTVNILAGMVMSNTAAAEGGGVWNSGAGTMNVDKVVIAYNSAEGTTATRGGGGVFNVGGPLHVSNSTIGENSAANNGGGVKSIGGETMLTNVTINDNTDTGDVSSIFAMTGTVTLRNSIVASSDDSPLCAGDIVDESAPNLASDDSCGASIVDDPMLQALQDNGGSTMTYALDESSKAVDAGDDVICAAAPINNFDQRGFTRLRGVHCDLGAFESDELSEFFRLWLFWIGKDKSFD
jgi:hypothetical protein